MLFFDSIQPGFDSRKRFFPTGLDQLAPFADHRFCRSGAIQVMLVAEASLHAQFAMIGSHVRGGAYDVEYVVSLNLECQIATDRR